MAIKPSYRLTDKGLQKLKNKARDLSEKSVPNDEVNITELSEKSGFNRDTISRILKRKLGVNLKTLRDCFSSLGIDLDELVGVDYEELPRTVVDESTSRNQAKNKEVIQIDRWDNIKITEISSRTERKPKQWCLTIEGNLDELNAKTLEKLEKLVQELSGDSTQKVIKITKGSIVLKFAGSEVGFERMQALFESGQLTDIGGFSVREVRAVSEEERAPTRLSEWLEGIFSPVWESVEELLRTSEPNLAFRSIDLAVARRKTIALAEDAETVELAIAISPLESGEVTLVLQILPSPGCSQIPEGLQVRLLDESDREIPGAEASEAKENIQFDITAELGDRFSLMIEKNLHQVLEPFII
jgi:transcriptional regulator with XRE-family HTH domain